MQPPKGERRNGDRRRLHSAYPPDKERRRGDRRKKVLAAGLLATMAAVATPRVAAVVWGRRAAVESRVDVSTGNFRVAEPQRVGFDRIIQEAAMLNGISVELIQAVIQTESQFDPFAVSPVGARGLMQLMPHTARWLGVQDPMDPRQNILAGTKYLSMLLERFNGNVALALAGYNAGPTVVARHRGIPPYGETRGYVRKIHKLVADTAAAFHLPQPPPPTRRTRLARRGEVRITRTLSNVRKARASLTRRAKLTSARKSAARSSRARAPALRARTSTRKALAPARSRVTARRAVLKRTTTRSARKPALSTRARAATRSRTLSRRR